VGPSLARLLKLTALVICLITVASFALFAVNQTKSAATHQQEVLNSGIPVGSPDSPSTSAAAPRHVSTLHRAIDDASNALTSPFSGVTASSSSEWLTRSAKLLLALIVYGFGLGFLARMIRVRM
jgi:hypothetical protein